MQALDANLACAAHVTPEKRPTDKENNDLLLANMKLQVKRTCRFRCALCVADASGKVLVETDGICEGMLLHEPLGNNASGMTRSFGLPSCTWGLGEATPEEKNKISHRGKAVKKLIAN